MTFAVGSWTGTVHEGKWCPQIDPTLVDDPRFSAIHATAAGGVSFAGATVLITGASDPGSIGFAVARNFCLGGARVVVVGSRDLGAISATAAAIIAGTPGSALPVQANQGDLADVDALMDRLKADGVALTHVYPFAAINHPTLFVAIKPEDYARVFQVNVFGVYHLIARHARLAPRKEPWYVIVPLSPNDGRLQGSGLYPATKQALRPIVVQGQHEVGDRRNGHYIGVSIAWTRSALMKGLEAGVAAARAAGLKVFETADTADVCTLCGTPAAQGLKGSVLDAAGGFGQADAGRLAEVFKGH